MKRDHKFLEEFAKRYEYTLMDLDLAFYTSHHDLFEDISKVVCSPGYTYDNFFQDYCSKLTIYFKNELQNSLRVYQPGKINDYEMFYQYSNSMYDNFLKIVKEYFNDMLMRDDVYVHIASDLKLRVIAIINTSKSSTKRSIELVLDAHNLDCKIKLKENIKSLFMKILEQFASILKPNI